MQGDLEGPGTALCPLRYRGRLSLCNATPPPGAARSPGLPRRWSCAQYLALPSLSFPTVTWGNESTALIYMCEE